MGAFGGLILTNKGRSLQAKAQAGTQLNFTRIAVGDGSLNGQSISDLNALISEKKSLSIIKLKTQTGGKAVVGAVLTNDDVTTGFYFRELGVFAQDPDEGEILYCYGNAGTGAEYIPAGGGADIVEKHIDCVTIVGNSSSISATIDSSLVYASQSDLQAQVDKENSRQIENIGYGIQSGLAVSAASPASMNVSVAPGTVYVPNGERFTFASSTILTVTAADATNPRKDIIYVSASGAITYLAGTPASAPAEPAPPSGASKLCVIDVPAGDTAIEQVQITDSRVMLKNLSSVDAARAAHEADDVLHRTQAEKDKLAGIEAGAEVNDVTSVAGKTGAVTLTKVDVGLGSVTNDQQLPIAGGAMTGKISLKGSVGVIGDSTGSKGELEVRSDNLNAAFIPFHRMGAYASYFGLDTDNKWKVGGWSMGANSYELWHRGNTPQTRILNGQLQFLDGGVWKDVGMDMTKYQTNISAGGSAGGGVETTLMTITNITGEGFFSNIYVMNSSGTSHTTHLRITVDGVVIYDKSLASLSHRPHGIYTEATTTDSGSGANIFIHNRTDSSNLDFLLPSEGRVDRIDEPWFFKQSLKVEASNSGANSLMNYKITGRMK